MHLDGEEKTVTASGVASAPRGVPHAFRISGADEARLLCLHTPGCRQAFYWRWCSADLWAVSSRKGPWPDSAVLVAAPLTALPIASAPAVFPCRFRAPPMELGAHWASPVSPTRTKPVEPLMVIEPAVALPHIRERWRC